MNKSIHILLAGSLAVWGNSAVAMPAQEHGIPWRVEQLQLQELPADEMHSTYGELVFMVPVVGALTAGLGAAAANALGQYRHAGEVDVGEVALVGVGGLALGGVNAVAAHTRNITVLVTAAGIDIAATTALALADQPADPGGQVESPEQQLPHPDWRFDPATLPPPEVIYQPNYYPVNPDFSSPFYPQDVWQMDEVSAGSGEEHYQYF